MNQLVVNIKTSKTGEVVFSDIIKLNKIIEFKLLKIDGIERQIPMSIEIDKDSKGVNLLVEYEFFKYNYALVIRAISKLSSRLMREMVKIDRESVTVIRDSVLPIYEVIDELYIHDIGIAEIMTYKLHVLGLYTVHDRLLGINKSKKK